MSSNLLDEALGLHTSSGPPPPPSRFVLVEDRVETSGAFVLHHLLKRALSDAGRRGVVLFVALAQPFSHYDRVLRKLGCNLSAQRENNNLYFFDMLKLECHAKAEGGVDDGGIVELFDTIQRTVKDSCSAENSTSRFTIMIDDIYLLEIATRGSVNLVLDFIHYLTTLSSEMDCSIVLLSHADIYSDMELPKLLLHLEYLADIVIKAEPLTTGLATDVHGQLIVINKGVGNEYAHSRKKTHNFHFKVKENGISYFYPGQQA